VELEKQLPHDIKSVGQNNKGVDTKEK